MMMMDVMLLNPYYFFPIQILDVFQKKLEYDIYNLYAVNEHDPGVIDAVNTIHLSASHVLFS